ncbi:DNA (cytosine-5)-methyltransferase DRM1A [Camellia lanceoleosa]|uniref:DNA (Cytosine-5)-methyltransferase DRM1A n=1 Tax=Camellia lanceoleosa TaxID=1840588 RepID=A0ACC0G9U1_9ERIC|nr:DNA (cytosine-5)-methyltransferase DRM1A [Camellia lanceoleosa]
MKESTNNSLEKDRTVSLLVEMGYEAKKVLIAINRCGLSRYPITKLSDFIYAVQIAMEVDFLNFLLKTLNSLHIERLGYESDNEEWKGKRQRAYEKKPIDQEDDTVCYFPNPMIGFGVPSEPWCVVRRTLPKAIKGNLIHIENVQDLDAHMIAQWVESFGGFDLVISGRPCNNLAGGNRVSRDRLKGKQSTLFFDYFYILDLVKSMMNRH